MQPASGAAADVRARLIDEVHGRGLAEREDDGDALELTAGERLHVLVHDILQVHRLQHISLELRVHEGLLDLLQEQHPDRPRELRRDRLRLERDADRLLVRLHIGRVTSEQPHERGLDMGRIKHVSLCITGLVIVSLIRVLLGS